MRRLTPGHRKHNILPTSTYLRCYTGGPRTPVTVTFNSVNRLIIAGKKKLELEESRVMIQTIRLWNLHEHTSDSDILRIREFLHDSFIFFVRFTYDVRWYFDSFIFDWFVSTCRVYCDWVIYCYVIHLISWLISLHAIHLNFQTWLFFNTEFIFFPYDVVIKWLISLHDLFISILFTHLYMMVLFS